MGSQSATPIRRMTERLEAFRESFGTNLRFFKGDLSSYNFVENVFKSFRPEAIVHLGEMPSAPYSMIDVEHTAWTQVNNIVGTLNMLYAMRDICPDSHLVKLGTMGEYGTPNVDIPEGFFEIEYRGRKDRLPFPRQAGSWYHQSKVHDSNNVMFACRVWGLRSTDVMQGVVYGTRIDEMGDDERLMTRFDFDQQVLLSGSSRRSDLALRQGPSEEGLPRVKRLDAVSDDSRREPARSGRIQGVQPVRGRVRHHGAGGEGPQGR
jgi:UDP-sulfoquinovose synthase